MNHTQIHDHNHANREMTPSPLKVNKDSHFIKKSSPSSSSSSTSSSVVINGAAAAAAATTTPQPRHPVIIYTHSPKVIHTNPKDFMALVQKLTGFSRPEDENHQARPLNLKREPANDDDKDSENNTNHSNNNPNNKSACSADDNESSSVITDENGSSINGGADGHQVNSSYVPHIFDSPAAPCFNSTPFYNSSSADFLCTNPPFYSYSDSLLMMPAGMRSSMSSSTLESMRELPEF